MKRARIGAAGMGRWFGSEGGFTLIELLTVMVLISIIAAIAMPRLRRSITKARAAEVIGELNVIKVAAITYQADRNAWPAERGPGVVPPGLEAYLPEGFSFTTPEYTMDYDNMVGSGVFDIGLTIETSDSELGLSVVKLLNGAAYNVGDRYTWVIIP